MKNRWKPTNCTSRVARDVMYVRCMSAENSLWYDLGRFGGAALHINTDSPVAMNSSVASLLDRTLVHNLGH